MIPTGEGRMAYPYGDYDALAMRQSIRDTGAVIAVCTVIAILIIWIAYPKIKRGN